MSKPEESRTQPRSMRHKRILDVAADDPEATIEEIATEIPSATPDLVENVLEKYGDPASDESSGTVDSGPTDTADGQSMTDSTDQPPHDHENLSEPQLETLRAIAASPSATQRELAESLDVTAATVSKRVNDIDGFDWADRQEFVQSVLETDVAPAPEETTMSTTDTDGESIDELTDRVVQLEERIDELAESTEANAVFDDPELLHKIVHACMDAETISEDEELRILKEFLQ